jgi:hypothetical protein
MYCIIDIFMQRICPISLKYCRLNLNFHTVSIRDYSEQKLKNGKLKLAFLFFYLILFINFLFLRVKALKMELKNHL